MRKRMGRRIAVWAAVLALAALTGCQNPQAETEEETDGREKTERETPDREAPEEETEAALTAQELEEWETSRDPEAFDPGRIGEFTADADVSGIAGFETWGDFGDVTEENLYAVWYCPEDGVSPGTVLILSADGARVYSPLLDRYGDRLYAWEVTDRSASGLCPALKIYFHGTDTGPLTYYIAGLEPEYFWCNSQQTIFYRQGGSLR